MKSLYQLSPGNGTLTEDPGEEIIGTADDDTFIASVNEAPIILGEPLYGDAQTLNNLDTVKGEAGDDTMNISAIGDMSVTLPTNASISGIETINFLNDSAYGGVTGTIDASIFEGAEVIRQSGDDAADVKELADGQTVAFDGVDADVDLTMADGAASLNVLLEGAKGTSDLDLNGDALTTVSVSGSMEDDGDTLSLHDYTDDGIPNNNSTIETLNISLSSNTTVDINAYGKNFDKAATFNASGSTGGITVDLTDLVSLETAAFGSGADDVTAKFDNEGDTTYDLGAGNDVFTLNGGTSPYENTDNSLTTITLGAGSDKVTIDTWLDNIRDGSRGEFESGLVVINDFNADEDLLEFSGAGYKDYIALNNTELGDIRGEASLFDAANKAASYLGGPDNTTVFDYGGDAYALRSQNDNVFNDTDTLIKLTGVSTSDFDASSLDFA